MSEQNKAVVRRLIEDHWNAKNRALVPELFAPTVTIHTPDGVLNGLDGASALLQAYTTAFPDFRLVIDDLVADADKVAFRWTFNGTHRGPLARQQGRIGHAAIDPTLPVKAFLDIGGAGHTSDAMAIWICQFVGREIRLLDYIEGVGQPLGYYAGELRRRGWTEAIICLPHDGVATNNITGKRYIDHWREAGFECDTPIKNTGAGAAMMRVEAARRIFPRCWFNEKKTEAGR